MVDRAALQAGDKHHKAGVAAYTPAAVPHLPPIGHKDEPAPAGTDMQQQQQALHQKLLMQQLAQQQAPQPLQLQQHALQQAQLQQRLQQQGVVGAHAGGSPRQPLLEPTPFATPPRLPGPQKDSSSDLGTRSKKGARDLQMELAVLKVRAGEVIRRLRVSYRRGGQC